jgi:hypothetical protein
VTVIAAGTMLLYARVEAYAQDAVPGEILSRTVLIKPKGRNEGGSAFTLDYKGKLYLVTARHVIEGVAKSGAIIEVKHSDKWEDYQTVRTLYPSSADADIAVFETHETAAQPFEIAPMGTPTTAGVTFGQQVWFIGYPFGMRSVPAKGSAIAALPFMKQGRCQP